MGVVDQPIQDRIADGGILHQLMPGGKGILAGQEGRPAALAVIEDLKEETILIWFERGQAPIVNDQQVDLGQLF